jgi:hypothetical protein
MSAAPKLKIPAFSPDDFADYFTALHREPLKPPEPPFPWQRRLAKQVAKTGRWPHTLRRIRGRNAVCAVWPASPDRA